MSLVRADPPTFPKGEIAGVGFHEAPRGTLSHWVVVDDGAIKNYQAVVPTTWNASPRDSKGMPGPYESALLGTPIADAQHPLEVLRTLMDANDLRQKDLVPIFGSESIVSEVLHKKRGLNKTHIEKLSKRFNVSPAVFF